MAIVVFSPEQMKLFQAFHSQGVRFIIVGLSSAVLQGAPVSTQDVDLWIENLGSESFCEAVKDAEGFYIPPGIAGGNPPMLGPEKFRLFDLVVHMHGLGEFPEEYLKCIDMTIENISLKVLPLDRIIASKQATNREKDRAVLPILETVLKAKNKL